MFIKDIVLSNFRIYKGENKISFEEDAQRNIYILAGYNGYGKTTFLTSLVWCLYGRHMQDVDDIFKKKIQEAGGYSGYLDACLNRAARNKNITEYAVTLTVSRLQIPGITAQEVEIKRSYSLGAKQDQLEIKIDGFRNELVEDVGNDIFIQDFLLPKEIAKFFFFDAEKITTIAEVQTLEQKRQLGKAYSEVLGIKKYVDLKNNLADLRLKYRRESASPEELEKLKADELWVAKLEHEIIQREQLTLEYNEDLEEKTKRSAELQEKLIREGSNISLEKLGSLKKEKSRLAELAKDYKERFTSMLDFAPFAIAGRLFFETEKQLNQEQQYNNQKGLSLTELKEAVRNIKATLAALPGHLTKAEIESQVNRLLDEHLTDDQPNSSSSPKVQILHDFDDTLFRGFRAIADNLRTTYKEQFKLLSRDIKRTRYELNEINKQLIRAESKEGDILIQKHRQEKATVDKEIAVIKEKILSLQREIGSFSNELNNRRKVLQELRKRLSVKEDLKDKDITAERLINKLEDFILRIQKEKKATLEARIRKGLNNLMHKKDFVQRVSVDVEGDLIDINLYNERNELIHKEDLSMGEKQLYATAILQALVEESHIEFPIFIDSPMQKLDAAHAKNIITDFYPKVSKQVVVLPLLNKEMTQEEFELFRTNVKGCYLIKNLDEDASTFMQVSNNELFTTAAELDRKEEVHV
ncbi:AAA family ATPase [Pontibacter anaerobius]|uniref:AAA family ATPase n=1 Tax=Pontibacter anaerobius TaxID=2993940 RepID=A0ABT3RHW8_9BACT|nr:AAA family ATPase [Pontibacter anaerobius]MCX2741458.1 AAA family ATPase [Pontibacter anaerobius]